MFPPHFYFFLGKICLLFGSCGQLKKKWKYSLKIKQTSLSFQIFLSRHFCGLHFLCFLHRLTYPPHRPPKYVCKIYHQWRQVFQKKNRKWVGWSSLFLSPICVWCLSRHPQLQRFPLSPGCRDHHKDHHHEFTQWLWVKIQLPMHFHFLK